MAGHKKWLDSEYEQWIAALRSSTVHNFKEHPMVKRMLGEFEWLDEFKPDINPEEREVLTAIDNVGRYQFKDISGACWRMIYYAKKVLEHAPESIIEIGGGSGQFYAVLKTLGFRGDYYIYDLPEVKVFQYKYLVEVMKVAGLVLTQIPLEKAFCVSLYALGEFDDELKQWYVDSVIKKKCKHGFMIWNPHSGASSKIPFRCTVKDEHPLLAEGNKQLEW